MGKLIFWPEIWINVVFYTQVLDPETGWTQFRPYTAETWAFLRARFKCPFLLLSATMEEESLCRIAGLGFCYPEINLMLLKLLQLIWIYQERR